MELKVVFNNESINDKFSTGWGFSCLVEGKLLFDTGEKSEYLFNNMKIMNIDISKIDSVVISHDHWDHTGGLWELLEKRKGIDVYSCPGFSQEFKDKIADMHGALKEADGFTKITDDIYTTGDINHGDIAEQALVVKATKGLVVVTGCSHPGIVRIVEKVKSKFPKEKIGFVFGGFHLFRTTDKREIEEVVNKLKILGVEKVGPTHCTGDKAQEVFKQVFRDNCVAIKAGEVFNV
jgi:7,8-dihydropterin-6-yl-methyl-4-(beta-D-ribofuranosyl)aminobenzene 5'-phosphate synthase